MRTWVIVAISVAVLGGATTWLVRRSRAKEVRYETAKVERGDLVESVTATGTLQARVTVQVGSQVSGTIASLAADYNDHVKQGQVLAVIDPEIFQAQVAEAKAALALAGAELERSRAVVAQTALELTRANDLAQSGYLAAQNLDQQRLQAQTAQAEARAASARVEQAQAQLNRARVNLENTVIRSPIDGVVISRSVDDGQTVAASLQAPTLFLLAADLSQMEVQVNVDEADVGRLATGQTGRFQVDAFPGEDFVGALRQIRNASITLQNVVTYVAVFDVDNSAGKLRPGMTTNVTIETARKKDVLLLPNAALRFSPPEANDTTKNHARKSIHEGKVYRLVGGQPQPLVVKLGITDGDKTEVTGGNITQSQELVVGSSDHAGKPAHPTPGFRRPF